MSPRIALSLPDGVAFCRRAGRVGRSCDDALTELFFRSFGRELVHEIEPYGRRRSGVAKALESPENANLCGRGLPRRHPHR